MKAGFIGLGHMGLALASHLARKGVDLTVGNMIRVFLKCGLFVFGVTFWATVAQAQTGFPNHPIRAIVPFAVGSGTDTVARVVAKHMQDTLGQAVIVENRVGADGLIGAEVAAHAAHDGYTVFITSASLHSLNPSLFEKLPYNTERDFLPVGGIMEAYYTLLVNNSLPVSNLGELATWLKAHPESASYGWGATVGQIAGASMLKRLNIQATGVPYKSSPQAVADLMGGQFTFMFNDVTTSKAHLLAKRIKSLGVTSAERITGVHELPTLVESGLPDFVLATWVGMLVPTGTPTPIVDKLAAALDKAVRDPEVAKKMDTCCSARMLIKTPAEFGAYMRKDRAEWAARIAEVGIQPK